MKKHLHRKELKLESLIEKNLEIYKKSSKFTPYHISVRRSRRHNRQYCYIYLPPVYTCHCYIGTCPMSTTLQDNVGNKDVYK